MIALWDNRASSVSNMLIQMLAAVAPGPPVLWCKRGGSGGPGQCGAARPIKVQWPELRQLVGTSSAPRHTYTRWRRELCGHRRTNNSAPPPARRRRRRGPIHNQAEANTSHAGRAHDAATPGRWLASSALWLTTRNHEGGWPKLRRPRPVARARQAGAAPACLAALASQKGCLCVFARLWCLCATWGPNDVNNNNEPAPAAPLAVRRFAAQSGRHQPASAPQLGR